MCNIIYIKKKKKRHKYIYNSEFSRRVSLIVWSRVGLEKYLLMLHVFLYQRRGMKYLLILFEFLIVYVGGYPGVFLKSCSLSSSGDGTWILVARDRCWFFMFPMQCLSVVPLLSFMDAEAGKSWGVWQLWLVYLALFWSFKMLCALLKDQSTFWNSVWRCQVTVGSVWTRA